MKAICIVVQSVYDFDPRVRRKAEALAAAGYSVDVLALVPPTGATSYILNGVNVHAVSLGKKRGSLARYLFEYVAFFLWAFIRVSRSMRHRHYAVIDVNTLPDFLIFAPVVARWMGAKLILDMHEITPEFYMSKYGFTQTSRIVRLITWLEKISFTFADRVITIHKPAEDLLVSRGLPREKSTILMNSVDETRFSSTSFSPGSAAPEPADTFTMMYHGTLTRMYGLDLAIEALGLAHDSMPGARLWILGSGPEQPKLQLLANERGVGSLVKFIGQVPSAEIPRWLDECDLGLLPLRRDVFLDFAFPNKLPEYICAGKPVLISRLKTMRYYFSDKALAFFEPNDAADLAAQMVRLYRDRPLRNRLVVRAREEYAPMRWDLMKQRYLSLIEELATSRSGTEESRVNRPPVA